MKDFDTLFETYSCNITESSVKEAVAKILQEEYAQNNTKEVYKRCLSLIDLTTLSGDDTETKVLEMTNQVNDFAEHFPHLDNVAAICIYPALVPTVKAALTADHVAIASVTGGFPASQTFIEIKVAETSMAVMEGATEVDVVISIGKFLEENYEEVYEELCEMKEAARNAHVKVIIESGALRSAANIKKASVLSMEAGADFIKTSTGKMPISATLETTYIMATAIKAWHAKTGKMVGYKPAGGIVTTQEAVEHYTIVKSILGDAWLNNTYFRLGASRLANNLLTDIEGADVKYF